MRECQGANQLQTNLSVLFVELFFAKDLCFFGLSPKTENFRHFYFYLGHPGGRFPQRQGCFHLRFDLLCAFYPAQQSNSFV